MFLALKSIVDNKALKTLDDEILRLHKLNKYKLKVFIFWKQQHIKEQIIKR